MIPARVTSGIAKKGELLVLDGIDTLYGYALRSVSAEGTVKLIDGGKEGKVVTTDTLAAKTSTKMSSANGVEVRGNTLWIETAIDVEYVIYWL